MVYSYDRTAAEAINTQAFDKAIDALDKLDKLSARETKFIQGHLTRADLVRYKKCVSDLLELLHNLAGAAMERNTRG